MSPLLKYRFFIIVPLLAALSGCTSWDNLWEGDRIDYKSETSKMPTRRLEIPPDLTQLQTDSRYSLPEAASGTITASDYNQKQAESKGTKAVSVAPGGSVVVAQKISTDAHIERDGSQRWLVVNRSPEALWQQIKEFWQDSGFLINIENPATGIMETDWAENRAKLPQDFIRRTLGKVIDSLYSTGERDKFRTRLERNDDGSTDIFVSHRGAKEELVGSDKESSMWTARASDPELEAEFLSRLMIRLTDNRQKEEIKAKKEAVIPQLRANLVKRDGQSFISADEGFDRLWRRVGLALDRVGFTVEDRDRSKGLYFVRYVDQDVTPKGKDSQKGFISRIFSSSPDTSKNKKAKRYRISVKETDDGTTRVAVLDNEGTPEQGRTGEKILSLLYAQLR
ncbi:MAG: outer membrane protein assembly factor BamC [Burkholderiaceae bacterium]|jgi:outer membrane protein assembly factor BamC|nr:outer membrane protein assembly factor BamC [Burkholderiaceae bacterium]